jgi:hypothetical protein
MLRLKNAYSQPALDDARTKRELEDPRPAEEDSFALLSNATKREDERAAGLSSPQAAEPARITTPAPNINVDERIEAAMVQPLKSLIEELTLCRRYYESTFPSRPVDRLIFIGGEARQRSLCLHIAREMQLAAQIGDPMVRMNKISDIGMESGIDRRQPQPGWAVAIGLSMGPAGVPALQEARA